MENEPARMPPEEKAKEIVGKTEKKTPVFQKLISSTFFKIFISFLLFFILFGVTFLIAIRSQQANQAPASSDEIPKAEVIVPEDEENQEKQALGEGCTVAGCNNELCLSEEEAAVIRTICVDKPEYICYKNAVCEKQESGECGWTQTEELATCLSQYQ